MSERSQATTGLAPPCLGPALQSGKLLPPALLGQAAAAENDEVWYGFAFIRRRRRRRAALRARRRFSRANAWFFAYPQSGWVTIALSNVDPPAAYRPLRWFGPRMPIE